MKCSKKCSLMALCVAFASFCFANEASESLENGFVRH